ncbi:ABC transporter permease [Parapedobacter pyrenivorans]|uniref:ABC transporter permease n=1 Tax=Parapedobacter pyrenivorans TaxID=1305674 RepID=A0A917HVU0_9SPHI|nr:ABC transporter permease subunit [Parapedobacter pyrenivorans]GGG91075.1 ABC transporter permease [Parapedobacter pyrenivorans]
MNRLKGNYHTAMPILVGKELGAHMQSWRFLILVLLIILTFVTSMYVSFTNLRSAVGNMQDPDKSFVYLKLLTTTDNSIPPFHVFLNFLAPLLGISLGFDAINSEQNNGTLTRLIAQPIYRDNLLLSKFASSLILIASLFLALVLLMVGGGLLATGVGIEVQEVLRIFGFWLISVVFVGFWLSLAILLSVKFKQAATSALVAIGIWLFFTVFFPIVVNLLVRSFLPSPRMMSEAEILYYNELISTVMRLSPGQLFSDASTTLLMPSVRSLGPLTMEQMIGAIPAPLPFKESVMIVWPQVSGLIAATCLCFAWTYASFMRREIRS